MHIDLGSITGMRSYLTGNDEGPDEDEPSSGSKLRLISEYLSVKSVAGSLEVFTIIVRLKLVWHYNDQLPMA